MNDDILLVMLDCFIAAMHNAHSAGNAIVQSSRGEPMNVAHEACRQIHKSFNCVHDYRNKVRDRINASILSARTGSIEAAE